jgi:EAL domain-containing protein (putative c-di-GMP-specific phosphodiesterase class I)
MDKDLLARKQIEGDLRSAIENNQLQLDYQPIVSTGAEKIIGVEALCRWKHPVRGEIAPTVFIPIAENSGLIIGLGEWVLRRACLDAMNWPGIFVSVNVSTLQFRRPDFPEKVERILSETGLEPSRLEIEITETTLIGNTDAAEIAMDRLKALGVQLVLDDFGTGYSSLLHLRQYPFNKLKVDRSFINAIERAADALAIVNAIVSLGRGLGIKVTAEGVETAGQRLFLRAAGVHSMQGYHISRPCPAESINAKLAGPPPAQVAERTDLAQAS